MKLKHSRRIFLEALALTVAMSCLAGCNKDEDNGGPADIPTVTQNDKDNVVDVQEVGEEELAACVALYNRMVECDVMSEGRHSCGSEGYSAEDECYVGCILAIPCGSFNELFCGEMMEPPSSLYECVFDCDSVGVGDEFGCTDGSTIPDDWVCDGMDDCWEGEDEVGCDYPDGMFMCDDGEYIEQYWLCDGYDDCLSGEDEVGCPTFKCRSGETISDGAECDGYEECQDGSDEAGCAQYLCTGGLMF